MKALLFAIAAFACAVPARADQGCIEISSVTVSASICTQLDCIQRGDNGCVAWACTRTQTSKYSDPYSSGCSRWANCGKKAVFAAGDPQASEEESTEQCDWYPCVQADASTGACLSYMCVSKRVTSVARTSYPNAACVPIPSSLLPQPAPQPAQTAQKPAPKPQPAPKPARKKVLYR